MIKCISKNLNRCDFTSWAFLCYWPICQVKCLQHWFKLKSPAEEVSEILNIQYNFKSLRYTETVNLTSSFIFICQLIAFKQHQMCLCFKQFMMYKQSSTHHLHLWHTHTHTHNHMRCKWTQRRQIAVGCKQAGLVWPADMLRAGIGGSVWAEHLSPLSTVRRAHMGLTADLQLPERRLSHPGALCMATYIFV